MILLLAQMEARQAKIAALNEAAAAVEAGKPLPLNAAIVGLGADPQSAARIVEGQPPAEIPRDASRENIHIEP